MPYFGYTPAGRLLHRLDELVASKLPWPPTEHHMAMTACGHLVLEVRGVREMTAAEAGPRPDLCHRCRQRQDREEKLFGRRP